MRSVLVLVLLGATTAGAVVLGGGLADTDCRMGFTGVSADVAASGVVCADGDACDADGTVDGACAFAVSLCTVVGGAGCSAVSITGIAIDGLPFDRPRLPTDRHACGDALEVSVADGAAMGATAIARDGDQLRDVDYLNLCCRRPDEAFAAARCALGVELEIAGCKPPHAIVATWARARMRIEEATKHPGMERPLARQAKHGLTHVRALAKKLARRNVCGDTIALVATHAQSALAQSVRQLPAR